MRPLIVVLDVETADEALALAGRLRSQVDLFKVGPVLFLKYGAPLLRDLQSLGARIFLDLKFHDIPSVVAKAVERAAEMGVYSATIHTAGGPGMMREAAAVPGRPRLWGVTVLTSLEGADLKAIGILRSPATQVERLAKLASACGLDGVIASVREAGLIKKRCGRSFQVVTPGVRLATGNDDQKRVETPAVARTAGADFFVMGRPVTQAPDPEAAVRQIYEDAERGGRP